MTNTKRKTDLIAPKYFTNLHGHSGFSLGDGLNNPKEHIDFALENGSDSLALTDHGNMNGFSHQYLHAKELKKKGVDFRAVFGVEAYFVPSLKNWQILYESEAIRKKNEKQITTSKKKTSSKKFESTNAYAIVENEAEEIGDAIKSDEDLEGTSTIENEEESKSNKIKNPLYQRNHLVLLAKNDAGLKGLFQMVSRSFKDGFYKYPRMDFDMLKQYANGNIIASSACIDGNAILQTNIGKLTLKQVVEKINKNQKIFVLSYSIEENRILFSKIVWGDLTKKEVKTLTIKLKNGEKIKCTPEHKFYTNYGWLRADELKIYKDTSILTNANEDCWYANKKTKKTCDV